MLEILKMNHVNLKNQKFMKSHRTKMDRENCNPKLSSDEDESVFKISEHKN